MTEERKPEEFETIDKGWSVYFDFGDNFEKSSCVDVRFSKNKYGLTSEDIENLKNDILDLGKLRIIKQGRVFLEK